MAANQATGQEAGAVYVSVMPSGKGFSRAMDNDLSSGFSGAASKGTLTFGQMFRRVAAAGAAVLATVGIGRLLKDTIALGVSYNTLEQSSKAAFTTLLGTAEAASEMQQSIRDFAMTSPFPRQAFIEGSQQLLAFGVQAEKVIPTLGAVQDAVAAAGGGSQELQDIIFVMAQISAAGKITGQDLIQFGQRGINAAELIGSQMGKTGAQIKADITAGTLGAEEAMDALTAGMAEKFGGAADNLKQTWVGSVDRIKGAWRDLASELVAPFIDPDGGGYAIEWANKLADFLREFQKSPAFDALKKKVEGFAKALDPVLTTVGDLFSLLLEDNGMDKFLTAVKEIGKTNPTISLLASVVEKLSPVFPVLADSVAKLVPSLEKLLPQLATLAEDLLPPITDALSEIADFAANFSIPTLNLGVEGISDMSWLWDDNKLNEITKKATDGLYGPFWEGIFTWATDFDKGWVGFWDDFGAGWEGFWRDLGTNVGNIFGGMWASIQIVGKSGINGLIDLVNLAIGAINGLTSGLAGLPGGGIDLRIEPIPQLAKSGTVLPRPGGTLILAAEAGRAESVVDTGKLNDLMDAASTGGGSRPIYADGIGLLGWLENVAGEQARLVFNTQILSARTSKIGVAR